MLQRWPTPFVERLIEVVEVLRPVIEIVLQHDLGRGRCADEQHDDGENDWLTHVPPPILRDAASELKV